MDLVRELPEELVATERPTVEEEVEEKSPSVDGAKLPLVHVGGWLARPSCNKGVASAGVAVASWRLVAPQDGPQVVLELDLPLNANESNRLVRGSVPGNARLDLDLVAHQVASQALFSVAAALPRETKASPSQLKTSGQRPSETATFALSRFKVEADGTTMSPESWRTL